jgi:hypothetical protein
MTRPYEEWNSEDIQLWGQNREHPADMERRLRGAGQMRDRVAGFSHPIQPRKQRGTIRLSLAMIGSLMLIAFLFAGV